MCRLVPGKLWVRVSEREDAAAWGVAPSGLTEGRTCMGWVVRGGGGCQPLGSLPRLAVQLGQVRTVIVASGPVPRDSWRPP